MASNDNLRGGFDDLLSGINKELDSHKASDSSDKKEDVKQNGTAKSESAKSGTQPSSKKADNSSDKSPEQDDDIKYSFSSDKQKTKEAKAKDDSNGTRVFGTVKPTAQEQKDLSDFELPDTENASGKAENDNVKKYAPMRKQGNSTESREKSENASANKTNVFNTVDKSTGNSGNKKPVTNPGASGNKNSERTQNTALKKASSSAAKKSDTKKSTSEKKKTTKKTKKKTGLTGSIAKFVLYIVFVVAASALCSSIIINVANDVFAFVKEDKTVTIELSEGDSTKQVANILADNGIIKYPTIFSIYTDFKKGRSTYYADGYKTGSFELSPTMNYDDLIYSLSNSAATREIVRLTFPEGSTIDEIIDILIAGGVQNTKEEYIDVIQNYDFNYRFIKELETDKFKSGRKYRLEGYLFPDTYDFYTDAGAVDVINKFLINFNNKFDTSFYDAAYGHGLTVDEIINIAALVEKEARRKEDLGKVSSVFHNRLKNKANYPYLQSDATIQYAFPERKTTITPEDLKYDSPYNTYLYSGLPPSAIANPGLDAITFALYPEDTSYYFFIANSRGETLFAKTLDGHNANIAMIRAENAE